MHGQRVKMIKAIRLHMAIVRLRAAYSLGPAGDPSASPFGLLCNGRSTRLRVVV